MRVGVVSVHVDDQAAALAFSVGVLGFVTKSDVPVGERRWLTVVSPERPDGVELLLEPAEHPAVAPYRRALAADGIPAVQLAVDDVRAEHDRLRRLGVTFLQEPTDLGATTTAVLDDTCGNLVQITAARRVP